MWVKPWTTLPNLFANAKQLLWWVDQTDVWGNKIYPQICYLLIYLLNKYKPHVQPTESAGCWHQIMPDCRQPGEARGWPSAACSRSSGQPAIGHIVLQTLTANLKQTADACPAQTRWGDRLRVSLASLPQPGTSDIKFNNSLFSLVGGMLCSSKLDDTEINNLNKEHCLTLFLKA